MMPVWISYWKPAEYCHTYGRCRVGIAECDRFPALRASPSDDPVG